MSTETITSSDLTFNEVKVLLNIIEGYLNRLREGRKDVARSVRDVVDEVEEQTNIPINMIFNKIGSDKVIEEFARKIDDEIKELSAIVIKLHLRKSEL